MANPQDDIYSDEDEVVASDSTSETSTLPSHASIHPEIDRDAVDPGIIIGRNKRRKARRKQPTAGYGWDRYLSGTVKKRQDVPTTNANPQEPMKRSSRQHKRSFWNHITPGLRKIRTQIPEIEDLPAPAQILVYLLSKSVHSKEYKAVKQELSALHQVAANWVGEASYHGSTRRTFQEVRVWVELSIADALTDAYQRSPTREDLIWSRYLPRAVQHAIVTQVPMAATTPNIEHIKQIYLRLHEKEGDVVTYLIIPKRSTKWYCGQAHRVRHNNGQPTPGVLVRALEHMAATVGKRNIASIQKDKPKARYTAWRQQGPCAVRLIPVASTSENAANELESYVIAKEQPGGNIRGRKVGKKEQWKEIQEQVKHGRRPGKTHRPLITAADSVRLNFWDAQPLVAKVLEGQWRPQPKPPAPHDVTTTTKQTPPKGDLPPFAEHYENTKRHPKIGPIDIYAEGQEELLALYAAERQVKARHLAFERVPTSRLMGACELTNRIPQSEKRAAAKGKLSVCLKKRGIKKTGIEHITLHEAPNLPADKLIGIIKNSIKEKVVSPMAREFWGKRLQFHRKGEVKLETKLKNMRKATREFDLHKVEAVPEAERKRLLTEEPIQVINMNSGVRYPRSPQEIISDNIKIIRHSLNAISLAGDVQKTIYRKIKEYGSEIEHLKTCATAQELEYLTNFQRSDEQVATTLDRNVHGVAILSKAAYHQHLHQIFATDSEYYVIHTDPEVQRKVIERAKQAQRRHKPFWARNSVGDVLGYEYANLKEKWCLPSSQAAPTFAPANSYTGSVRCPKPHCHWREVSAQSTGVPKRTLQSAQRNLTRSIQLDPYGCWQSRGLHKLPSEIIQLVKNLSCCPEYEFECMKCHKPKDPAVLVQGDLS